MTQQMAFDPQDQRQMLGLAGSVVLAFGVFAPLVSAPILGHLNYFRNGQGDGVIVLILAGAGAVLSLLRNFKGVLGTGLASLALMIVTFVHFQAKMSEIQTEMQQRLAGNPFRGLAEAAVGSIQLEWGWGVLLVGVGLMVASGLVGASTGRRSCPHCAERIQMGATLCRFCGREVTPAPRPTPRPIPAFSGAPDEMTQCRHCHEMMWSGAGTCAACGTALDGPEHSVEAPPPVRVATFAVVADRIAASQRAALIAIVKQIDPARSDSDLQEALGRADISVAIGLSQEAANRLMLTLHEAGISARKRVEV